MCVTYTTISVEKTMWLGQQLGLQLISGDIIALIGDLGGGKTWFTKGIALGLDINPNDIVSPTFTLVNEYQGKQDLFHIDLYRLQNDRDILTLDLEEYFLREGIVVIEWADRWSGIPEERIQVELKIINDHTREVTFSANHQRAKKIIGALRAKNVNQQVAKHEATVYKVQDKENRKATAKVEVD
jgi:tRNA threonylcarbamoyladenosine biosynthesis protein TsaE